MIKRCVQLIWGEEVLQAYPADKALADRVFTLIQSKEYLAIFIKHINLALGGVLGFDESVSTADGKYENLSQVFPDYPSGVKTSFAKVAIDTVNRDLLNKIIDDMRKEALGVTLTP